jgi:hypothetical protein
MDDRKEIALAEYKEVADQFRKLTDIRFQLLTYLPVGTTAAAFFVAKDNELVKHPEISAFAFIVTLCIATYDKRNDQHYDELVSRAAELERELQIERGIFADRPRSWLKYGFGGPRSWSKYASVPVDHRWPIGLIYAAAAGLWAYLFMDALDKDHCWLDYLQYRLLWLQPCLTWLQFRLIWLKLIAPFVVIACWRGLRWMEKAREKRLRKAVKGLMMQLVGLNVGALQAEQAELVKQIVQERILNVSEDKAERRVACHCSGYDQKWDSRAASALLAAVIDLPARWIEDVWTGRREE